MKIAKISPGYLSGEVTVPPSKSETHRAIICAALSKGISIIKNVSLSEDVKATIDAMKSLGARFEFKNNYLTIDSTELFSVKEAIINCNESGSTLRFLIPLAAAEGISACFIGKGNLPKRPIGIYLDCLPKAGVSYKTDGGLPLKINGNLKPGVFNIPGNVSSQFITGLLLALPSLKEDSYIFMSTPLESAGYVDLTINVMKNFGVNILKSKNGFYIKGNQHYVPREYKIEGDWSQAAFFMSAAAISPISSNGITIHGLNKNSYQGDCASIDIFKQFGAEISWHNQDLLIKPKKLSPINKIDVSQIPDLVPIISVTAMFADGTTSIFGAKRLKIKESDRLVTTSLGLDEFGTSSRVSSDEIIINGNKNVKGCKINGFNDHRIVMSMAIGATMATGDVLISDAQSINKSYPLFFEDFKKLGGNIDVVDIW